MNTRARRISIRARLGFIYAAVLGIALLLYGTGVYVVLRDQLERSVDAQLMVNVEHAADAFAQDIDASGRVVPSERLLAQLASTGGRVIVLEPDGSVIADSAQGDPGLLGIGAQDLALADADAPSVRQVEGEPDVRLTVRRILGDEGASAGYVVWADTARPVNQLLADVTAVMLVGGLLVIVLAALVGLALARRALAPISEVTDTARAIALSGDLGARVAQGQARDEVADLAVAFNEMLAALQQSQETLRQFLGDVSHQLRTPLTTIHASLDLAQREDLPAAERQEILVDAREETERMARLVKDLLSLARAESGARLELGPVELDALLVDSVRLQRQAVSHIQMSVSSVEPAIVEGDADRLRELFGILLDNAARYTPQGGSVVASLSVDRHSTIVSIEDTGIGIDEEDRVRLFERLHRGTRARRMRPSGTGLGLAIALWIVESHAGTIELEGRAAGGTAAIVTLPLRSA
ncbi:MAG: ATP-binding protein [Chloroflexota bacterium]